MACAAAVWAQAQPSKPAPDGLEPSWDVGAVLQEISAHATRLLPTLNKVDAKAWVAKGAPDTYAQQLDSCKVQAAALATDAKALTENPEKLSAALVVFFRMQSLENMMGSLVEGLRKYGSNAEANELARQVAENGANRSRLQAYIVNLAAEREQEFQVMDHEAQRCRAAVATQSPVTGRTSGRKN